ncbi:hypothetical protein VFPPC_15815 [Pochonia chlamydosporia 170]|uniref:Uncharacterized protein n=1 Tax=Pochonia chlamydosporia 170 TaxID=1380566 RepID=A0A179FTJ5_METCM|nr:hypothetical protein VFPPC_15815 [Pochonia chlamydosporia 170]OAQ68339.1 hypothetical protein VFPPC_15815 [Pochonia chlamydosporia 170]
MWALTQQSRAPGPGVAAETIRLTPFCDHFKPSALDSSSPTTNRVESNAGSIKPVKSYARKRATAKSAPGCIRIPRCMTIKKPPDDRTFRY